MVELMITIAIVGTLSAVSVSSFKYYSSKSKTVEAKVQLASVYTAQLSFYNAYDMYANCLSDMGYIPALINQRYYAVGFPSITANIDSATHSTAVSNNLGISSCPRDLSPSIDQSFYLAGNGAGDSVVNTQAIFQAIVIAAEGSDNDLSESSGNSQDDVTEGIGSMADLDSRVFVMPAVGYIDSNFSDPASASVWTISSDKRYVEYRKGY